MSATDAAGPRVEFRVLGALEVGRGRSGAIIACKLHGVQPFEGGDRGFEVARSVRGDAAQRQALRAVADVGIRSGQQLEGLAPIRTFDGLSTAPEVGGVVRCRSLLTLPCRL